jgi:hypothetical protein
MDLFDGLIKLANALDKQGNFALASKIDDLIKQAKKTLDDKIKERFWAKVKKTPTCYWWNGAKSSGGYGILTINNKNYAAHKLAWEWANNKKVPKGMVLLHSCDNRSCVNSDHLTPGTQQANVDDRVGKDRSAKGKDNGRARLDKADVKKIRQLREQGMSEGSIAKLYGVGRSTISHIVHNRTWQWL